AYRSVDGGETWIEENEPVYDTGHYGAPPSLVKMEDGRLALAYAYRSQYGSRLCLRFSSDDGETWGQEIPVRSGDGANGDVGYPQMVQREDGKLVIVYYWNHALNDDPTRYIAASIVEPELFE
ncbi:MAG: sialidase family protein, partial [Balneolaceae bacterium]|nr:sialidase family protein [Balneolaceae bacterium]